MTTKEEVPLKNKLNCLYFGENQPEVTVSSAIRI